MRRAALTLCIALALAATAQAADMRASVDDIISLVRNGLSNETILVFVQNRPVDFTGRPEEIVRLKEAGVSEEVIRYLLEHSAADDEGYAEASTSEQYVDYSRAYTDYASLSYYPSTLYYPRSYYGSLYVGTLPYPAFWYSNRYHGSRIVFGYGQARYPRFRSHRARARRHGGSFFIGGSRFGTHGRRHLRGHYRRGPLGRTGRIHRGHAFGFSTAYGGNISVHRFGASDGARFRGHADGHTSGVRGGFRGGYRAGMHGGFRGGHR